MESKTSKDILPESERVAIVGNNIILDDYLRNNWCEKLIKYQLALESAESENQKLREEVERLKRKNENQIKYNEASRNLLGQKCAENYLLKKNLKDLEEKVREKEIQYCKICDRYI